MIFVAYAHDDVDAAKRFTDALRKMGFSYFLDKEAIPGGVEWNEAIDQGARNCFAACVLLSDAALQSEFIWNEEIPRLEGYKKPILFFLIRELWGGDIRDFAAGLDDEDQRKKIAEKQWPRDPAEGPLPRDDADFRAAMLAVQPLLLQLVKQGKAEQERKRRQARFTSLKRAELLICERSVEHFGVVVADGEGFAMVDASWSLGHLGKLTSKGRIDRTVISPRGDLIAVQASTVRPSPDLARGAGGVSVTFWGLGTGGSQFSCFLGSGAAQVLGCWMASAGVHLEVMVAEGTTVEQWSVNPLRGTAVRVDSWPAVHCTSASQVEIEGEVSRLWIEANGVLKQSGPAQLASGFALGSDDVGGWTHVDLALNGSQVMAGGIRDDAIHVCLGTVTASGSVNWGVRKVADAMSALEIRPTSIAIGRVSDPEVNLGRFLVTDHCGSVEVSIDDL